jgi:hypothetical protein
LVDIGTELFAMASSCAYAHQLYTERDNSDDQTPIWLAGTFCTMSRRRIEDLFDKLGDDHSRELKLAKSVLDGDLRWLEEGVHTDY